MEYCITVLVETFEPGLRFRPPKPVETTWGRAWRTDEEGHCFWDGGLYVGRATPSQHLVARLPVPLRQADWQALTIGGQGLQDFETCVNQAEDEWGPRRPGPTTAAAAAGRTAGEPAAVGSLLPLQLRRHRPRLSASPARSARDRDRSLPLEQRRATRLLVL